MGEHASLGGTSAIGAVVLAAGRSSRMGAHKLLLPLGGRALVTYAVAAACVSAADPVVVVLGHDAERVRAALPPARYRTVTNAAYGEGMATSLRVGIAALPAVAGALVLLADQPLMTSAALDAMIAEARRLPHAIVRAAYDGRPGHPVCFPSRLFPELLAATGDEGGRSVLARHRNAVRLVQLGAPALDLDVDAPEQYEALRQVWQAHSRAADS
jgi:molybdenum cofactor cytidylyltransferase